MSIKKTPKKKKYLFLLILVLILIFLAGAWAWQGIYFQKNPKATDGISFLVKRGDGLVDIARKLQEKGVIKSATLFQVYALARRAQSNLMAGKYHLRASMNVPEVLNTLTSGNTIKEKITIVEGWDLRDIAWYFENKGMFPAEEFLELTGFPGVDYSNPQDLPLTTFPAQNSEKETWQKVMRGASRAVDFEALFDEFDFLKEKPKDVSLEGYLFPDTYEINEQGANNNEQEIKEIIRKTLRNFDKKITSELRAKIKPEGKALFEVLTMASLLEKEVKSYEDKRIVAGILWKRISSGWPLQVDATLAYLTGKVSSELTKEDLQIDSRYNTYKYYGLPLGPISNPGLESIQAAIYYKESPYWFYLTTPEGETIFSGTLQEHNIARAKYLK